MLPKNKRIPRKLFPLLKNPEQSFRNNPFFVKIARNKEASARFCVSVSKKVAKNAVLRNKIRRLGYRILGEYVDRIKRPILVQVSFSSLPKSANEVRTGLGQILIKANLIK